MTVLARVVVLRVLLLLPPLPSPLVVVEVEVLLPPVGLPFVLPVLVLPSYE